MEIGLLVSERGSKSRACIASEHRNRGKKRAAAKEVRKERREWVIV